MSGTNGLIRIKVLPPSVRAKLKAGEVITCPADVVKELVENSLDAIAKRISVRLKAGGKNLIEVEDDGVGMTPDELKLCYQPFTTSKIENESDLLSLATYGFRGEALHSIVSVAKVTISSKTQEDEVGAVARVVGGRLIDFKLQGLPKSGTKVRVEDLFFNLPVRRKHLRDDVVEFSRIWRVLSSIMLANEGIEFELEVGSKWQRFERADWKRRVVSVVGESKTYAFFEVERGNYRVRAAMVDKSFPGVIIVNGRYCDRVRVVNQALYSASNRVGFGARFYSWILDLKVPAFEIDVNVHPRKLEINFLSEEEVFLKLREIFISGLKEIVSNKKAYQFAEANVSDTTGLESKAFDSEDSRLFNKFENNESSGGETEFSQGFSAPSIGVDKEKLGSVKYPYLGQIYGTYLLFLKDGKLHIVDQHAAHERIRYEKIKQTIGVVKLMKPIVLEGKHFVKYFSADKVLKELGFEYDVLQTRVLVREVPAWFQEFSVSEAEEWFKEVVEFERVDEDAVLKQAACKRAIKAGEKLFPDEAAQLFAELLSVENEDRCIHGRPTYIVLDEKLIERLFKRGR